MNKKRILLLIILSIFIVGMVLGPASAGDTKKVLFGKKTIYKNGKVKVKTYPFKIQSSKWKYKGVKQVKHKYGSKTVIKAYHVYKKVGGVSYGKDKHIFDEGSYYIV